MTTRGAARQAFAAISTLLFFSSAAVTIAWCGPMSATGRMPMPGGWTMSMVWMRMPGQTWTNAAMSFLGMWVAMMAAMMVPSLVPVLWRYQGALAIAGAVRPGRLTALAGLGYFFVWTLIGLAVFAAGVALSIIAMRQPVLARAVPAAAGAVVLGAGLGQLTDWKTRQLACCAEWPASRRTPRDDPAAAWSAGLRLGVRCSSCCLPPMAVLLVLGVMDLRVMAVVTAAICGERLAPAGGLIARATGIVAVAFGMVLIARAVAL